MMRIIIALLSCTCFLKASSAFALQDYDARGDFNLSLYPHLTDTNQSQIFEPVSSPYPRIKLAKVHFLVDASDALGFDYSEPQFDLKNAAKCNELGFATEASACLTAGQNPAQLCPYDTSYTNACCDPAFKFRKAECSYPRTISSNSCNNKYRCYCDSTLYPYTTSNCAAPYVLADKCIDDSGSHYAECTCPSYYKPCDAAKNLIGVGAACNRNGETVYAQCECKAGYNQVCEQFGPVNANDYCLNGGKFYKSCKTCANNGTLDDCPAGMACTLEQCSGKYYVTGCGLNKGYVSIDYSWYKCWMKVETYAKPGSTATAVN